MEGICGMRTTKFTSELQQLLETLNGPDGCRVQGVRFTVMSHAQLRIIKEALDDSGCLYTVMDIVIQPTPVVAYIDATGSYDQLLTCVRNLLGH